MVIIGTTNVSFARKLFLDFFAPALRWLNYKTKRASNAWTKNELWQIQFIKTYLTENTSTLSTSLRLVNTSPINWSKDKQHIYFFYRESTLLTSRFLLTSLLFIDPRENNLQSLMFRDFFSSRFVEVCAFHKFPDMASRLLILNVAFEQFYENTVDWTLLPEKLLDYFLLLTWIDQIEAFSEIFIR